MIAHIMLDTAFAQPFIDLMSSDQVGHKQKFLIVTDAKRQERWFDSYSNVERISTARRRLSGRRDYFAQLHSNTKEASRVFVHGMFTPIPEFLLLHPKINRKAVRVIWGGDLYPDLDSSDLSTRMRLDRALRRRVTRRSPFAMTLTPGDGELLRSFARRKLPILPALYCNPVTAADLDVATSAGGRPHSQTRVLIGNSATSSNRHMQLISLLARYREQNIEVVAPLGAGDPAYARAVEAFGHRELGEKFTSINTMQEPSHYAQTLSSIDVAVFGNTRQQGLGTILALGYLGKKIYTPQANSSWDYLSSFMPVHATEEIEAEDFDQFSSTNSAESARMRSGSALRFDDAFIAGHWTRAFDWTATPQAITHP